MALADIGLDLLGQACLPYARVGQISVRLAELPNGDYAFSAVRLLTLSSRRLAYFEMSGSLDPVFAAMAAPRRVLRKPGVNGAMVRNAAT